MIFTFSGYQIDTYLSILPKYQMLIRCDKFNYLEQVIKRMKM